MDREAAVSGSQIPTTSRHSELTGEVSAVNVARGGEFKIDKASSKPEQLTQTNPLQEAK